MTQATDNERVLAKAAELSRALDDVDAARRLLAGPLLVAARGTLDRLAAPAEDQ